MPWDPCADQIEDESFVNSQLNDMMEKYKENNINKDMFYEEQKREKLKSAMEERLKNEQKQKEVQNSLEDEDPWLKSRFNDSVENTESSVDAPASTDGSSVDAPASTEVKEL